MLAVMDDFRRRYGALGHQPPIERLREFDRNNVAASTPSDRRPRGRILRLSGGRGSVKFGSGPGRGKGVPAQVSSTNSGGAHVCSLSRSHAPVRVRRGPCRIRSARACPVAGARGVGNTYLALGDSLAYGYHQAQFQEELKAKGYVEAASSTTATSMTSARRSSCSIPDCRSSTTAARGRPPKR